MENVFRLSCSFIKIDAMVELPVSTCIQLTTSSLTTTDCLLLNVLVNRFYVPIKVNYLTLPEIIEIS